MIIACLSSLLSLSAYAQSNVVVIPLGGDEDSSVVWAQRDGDSGGVSVTASAGRTELNSISINVKKDGYLVISGQVFINSNNATDLVYFMDALVDGATVQPSGNLLSTRVDSSEYDDYRNLNYTVTVPITKGTHTVSHNVGINSGAASYFYNKEYLTIMFFPAGTVETVNTGSNAAAKASTKQTLNSEGETTH
jgi:hypothetical protein